jgi:radical SAM superfamily enzyme YgiQ (UPF0313 family)
MSRIVFYEPATPHPHIFKRFRLPRLGSLLLGTILKQHGHDVKVFVEDIRAPKMQDLLDADIVCVSSITSTAPRAYAASRYLRSRGVPAVLGGPHVTFLTDEALEHADYVFRGEGENSIVDLVKAIETGDGLDLVPGLSFRRDGEVVHNGPAEPVCDLDELPEPDYSLLVGGLQVAWASLIMPVQTSRGCPHDCSFCSVTKMFGRRMRYRSVGKVLDELSNMDMRRKHVFFYDDHFAANCSRLREILEGILSRGLRFNWSAQLRVDLARHPDLLDLMRRAGCRTAYLGIESLNPATLKEYNKGQTADEIIRGVKEFRRHKIWIHGMFVLGADTDTVESIRETVAFAVKSGIETVQFLVLTPLPGTPYFDELKASDRLGVTDYRFYDAHHVVFEPKNMSAYELQREVLRGHVKFYSATRIISDVVRLKFYEALVRFYGRRITLKCDRMSRWFTDGLEDGLDYVRGLLEARDPLRLAGAGK